MDLGVSCLWTIFSLIWFQLRLIVSFCRFRDGLSAIYKLHLQQRAACRRGV